MYCKGCDISDFCEEIGRCLEKGIADLVGETDLTEASDIVDITEDDGTTEVSKDEIIDFLKFAIK